MSVTANIAQAHADAGPTEQAAARRIAPVAGQLRARVLQLIVDAGDAGLTATEAYELYVALYGEPKGGLYSCAPRLSELERQGWARKGEYIRENRHSYVATAAGREWAAQQWDGERCTCTHRATSHGQDRNGRPVCFGNSVCGCATFTVAGAA